MRRKVGKEKVRIGGRSGRLSRKEGREKVSRGWQEDMAGIR
jgi:hypothetical protein